MKHYKLSNTQQGLALLAAVLIITIFTIIGMMSAQRAKEDEKITGGTVRYGTVFEAAENSLRSAVRYLGQINGLPIVGDGSGGRDIAENFNVSGIDTNLEDITSNPSKAIVWSRETLEEKFCGTGGCNGGLEFIKYVDEDVWKDSAIISEFSGDGGATDNYINNTVTYTFIEELQSADTAGKTKLGVSRMVPESSKSGTAGQDTVFYLVTVKASGYPPGTEAADKIAKNARENVVLQAVFARR